MHRPKAAGDLPARYTKNEMNKYLTFISLVQVALIAVFLFCVWQAGKAMDKTGIGDLQLNQQYSSYACIAFYLAVALWVASIAVATFGKCFKDRQAQIAIGMPPLLMVFGWISLWFI